MLNYKIRKLPIFLIISVLFLSTCSTSTTTPSQDPTLTSTNIALAEVTQEGTTEFTPGATVEETPEITPTVYLPLVSQKDERFLGVYFEQYWTHQTVDEVMSVADQQTGKAHTSVGWFIDLQNIAFTDRQNDNNANNFYRQLEALWENGYISFVNLGSALQLSDYDVADNCPISFSLIQILNGECDLAIQKMADLYSQWVAQGGGRRAMIAPLQEMNGIWTSYGRDPNTSEQYIEAYNHILNIFINRGITRNQIWWVFAPNGYSDPGNDARKFENYYPGDEVVDIVGFSSYNYGYCPQINPDYRRWESYMDIFEPYIARMEVMASSKPIIIAETASTAYYHDANGSPVYDLNAMNQWLVENYSYFAHRNSVLGVFYFSFHEFGGLDGCEIELNPNGEMLSGYVTAAADPIFVYLSAEKLASKIP